MAIWNKLIEVMISSPKVVREACDGKKTIKIPSSQSSSKNARVRLNYYYTFRLSLTYTAMPYVSLPCHIGNLTYFDMIQWYTAISSQGYMMNKVTFLPIPQ